MALPLIALGLLVMASTAAASDPLLAPAGACPGAEEAPASSAAGQDVMLCEVNYARGRIGLAPLSLAPALAVSAADKTSDIFRCNSFSHGACGRSWLDPIRKAGYVRGCWQAGENLAWGQGDLGTPAGVMNAWLESPPHRANILSGDFVNIGVAEAVGSLLGNDEVTVWTMHLGSHCEQLGQAAPKHGPGKAAANGATKHGPRKSERRHRRGLEAAVVARRAHVPRHTRG